MYFEVIYIFLFTLILYECLVVDLANLCIDVYVLY